MLKVVQQPALTKRQAFEVEQTRLWETHWEAGGEKPSSKHLSQTLALLPTSLEGQKIVDLGCGEGTVARALGERGGEILAVDIAENALKRISHPRVKTKRLCLPYLTLPEEAWDGVCLTDVIAELPSHLHRLLIAECAALLKKEGWFLCSTPLDSKTEEPDRCFLSLLETEFEWIQVERIYPKLRWLRSARHIIVLAKKRPLRYTF